MPDLVLEGLTRTFGAVNAVDHVDLTIKAGTFVCLLGPSGCGKTTLLRMIAGLEEPTSGSLRLDGRDLTHVPTHRRDFGMVFQSLALFQHLDVAGNIAYPLKLRNVPRERLEARVGELVDLVRLKGFEHRAVSKLSGGQRQRVAIARALAVEPSLFLLDEPLSALDAKLREAMQVELRELQRRLGITTIVVTHDQREAMTMGDLVVVMNGGRIRQAASPTEVYRRPADAFVADFIGTTNLIKVRRKGEVLLCEGGQLPRADIAGEGIVSIRPESLALVRPDRGTIVGTVSFVRDLGASVETFVSAGDQSYIVVASPDAWSPVQAGDKVGLTVAPGGVLVLPS